MLNTEWRHRRDIVEVCQAMHAKGFLAATDGNVSVRWGDKVLITPTGVSKGRLKPEDILVTSLTGRATAGASSELSLHLCAYHARPDVQSVVHGHPPRAIAFTVAGREIPGLLLPEVVTTLGGEIPTIPYTTPTTEEVPTALGPVLGCHDVVMMAWHGAVCLGLNAWDAYYKLEKLEHLCEVALYAEQLGGARMLTSDQVSRLRSLSGGGGREMSRYQRS
ncbi:MAG: class II aldolase/adducin family protein [Candidatus Sericytochromatia bacterium]|nr:class II aldolase/adducin family protein [Candidatus Sericytochromatia bacterium]